MLQGWAAKTSHSLAKNPYPLYAASNAGSFFGLLAYPLLIEPRFSTPQQFSILSIGYLSLVLGFVYCAIVIRGHSQSPDQNAPAAAEAYPDKALLFRWLGYSAIPASLLFGTTTFIITDIASVPLLWIIPLMLYISSFIAAFSTREWNTAAARLLYFPLGLLTLFSAAFYPLASRLGITPIITVMLTLSALFVGAFLFHRRLYELRPTAQNSGLFYVVVASGGALGGCFNSFVAPQIFLTTVEFPLVLSLSLLVVLLPDFLSANTVRKTRFPYEIAALLLLLLTAAKFYISSDIHFFEGRYLAISGVLLMLVLFCRPAAVRLVLSNAAPWAAGNPGDRAARGLPGRDQRCFVDPRRTEFLRHQPRARGQETCSLRLYSRRDDTRHAEHRGSISSQPDFLLRSAARYSCPHARFARRRADRCAWARNRHRRLLRQARAGDGFLRDRSCLDPYRHRPDLFHLYARLRRQAQHHRRRRDD